jgi:YidC/Oxa1 family membrane protein insertase
MKALKPYQNEIKKKFKDNKDAQNRAISKLFEDAQQNPLAGCFISLAQLPVLLGLYRGIRNLAIDGNIDEPFLWIPSLQGPVTAETDFRGLDWLSSGWVDGVPPLGWEATLAFLVMPCLLVIGQSLTMSVLQPPVDEELPKEEREQMEKTQGFLKFLPLMIGFFSLQVPAGLTIYWFTTNLFTLASTVGARTYYSLNPPKIELPEYWDSIDNLDEINNEDKRELAKAGVQVGPTFETMLEGK